MPFFSGSRLGSQDLRVRMPECIAERLVRSVFTQRRKTLNNALALFARQISPDAVYRLNALLPRDIGIRSLREMPPGAHCRFDAESREYRYYIYGKKNPFLEGRAYFYPYPVNLERMQEAAQRLQDLEDFSSFCKRNTQVKNFRCTVMESDWAQDGECLLYRIRANRFLRGMVRGLTGTMLQVGRGILTVGEFEEIALGKNRNRVNFNVPAKGLFLMQVSYPEGLMC